MCDEFFSFELGQGYWLSQWCGGKWIAISPANSRWLAMTLFLRKILSCSISLLRGRRADFDEECSSVCRDQELMYRIFSGLDWTLKALSLVWQRIIKCLRCWYHVSTFLLFLCYDYYNSISKPSVLPPALPPPCPIIQGALGSKSLGLKNFFKLNILEQI